VVELARSPARVEMAALWLGGAGGGRRGGGEEEAEAGGGGGWLIFAVVVAVPQSGPGSKCRERKAQRGQGEG